MACCDYERIAAEENIARTVDRLRVGGSGAIFTIPAFVMAAYGGAQQGSILESVLSC